MTDNLSIGSDFLENILFPAANDGEEPTNPEEGAELPDDQLIEGEADEAEPEESDDSKDEEPKLYTFKAGGEDISADIDQLIELAQKGVGFNKNSEKMAREHKAEMALLAQERSAVGDELKRISDYLEVFGESEKAKEHMDYLQENDLPEFKRLQAMHEEIKSKAAAFRTEKANAEVQNAIQLLENTFPNEWKNESTRKEILESGAAFFAKLGVPQSEINNITQGHFYVAAIKAQLYDKIMAKADEAKKTPPKNITKKVGTTVKSPQKDDFDVVSELFPNL